MAFDYLKFLDNERLKAKEELDSAKLKLNLIMYEQFKEQQNIIHAAFDFKMIAKSAQSCIGITDADEDKKYKKTLATYISDYFGVGGIKVINVYQYGYDTRSYSIRFNTVGKACYELEVPNLTSIYWMEDKSASRRKADDISELIYCMDVRLRSVKGSERASICEDISSYLKDPDGFRNVLKEGK